MDRVRKAEKERDELAQRLQTLEEELSQSMQDVEDMWREKYSALEERHKEMLKRKAEMEPKIVLMETHEVAAEQQYKELSERCGALKATVTIAHQSEQQAVASQREDGQTIQHLQRQVKSVRREMAEWAGAEAAKEAQNHKRRLEDVQNNLAVALCSAEEAQNRETQLTDQLKAAEADTESYRAWCEQIQNELRLEKNANKEASKVSMQAAHLLENEKSSLQKQVTVIRLETAEAQKMVQDCKLEIDHLQHKLDCRERQLATAEDEVRQVQKQSAEKQEEIDSLMKSLEAMRLQWKELSGRSSAELVTRITEGWWEAPRPWPCLNPYKTEKPKKCKLGVPSR